MLSGLSSTIRISAVSLRSTIPLASRFAEQARNGLQELLGLLTMKPGRIEELGGAAKVLIRMLG